MLSGFSMADRADELRRPHRSLRLAASPEINRWGGQSRVELVMKDLQVEELIIGNNGITTEGVGALLASPGSLRQLKKIHLWHIGKEERGSPTDEQIAPLQALRPDVEIAY